MLSLAEDDVHQGRIQPEVEGGGRFGEGAPKRK